MNSASEVVITVKMLVISETSKKGITELNKLWMDFLKNSGGFVISEMNMSVKTCIGLLA